jgi:hypothetical protein
MPVEYCPYCGASNPGDPCRACGAGRNVPTRRQHDDWEWLLDVKEALASPGRLTLTEREQARKDYVYHLRSKTQ